MQQRGKKKEIIRENTIKRNEKEKQKDERDIGKKTQTKWMRKE